MKVYIMQCFSHCEAVRTGTDEKTCGANVTHAASKNHQSSINIRKIKKTKRLTHFQ